jgi:hypothetical protein
LEGSGYGLILIYYPSIYLDTKCTNISEIMYGHWSSGCIKLFLVFWGWKVKQYDSNAKLVLCFQSDGNNKQTELSM